MILYQYNIIVYVFIFLVFGVIFINFSLRKILREEDQRGIIYIVRENQKVFLKLREGKLRQLVVY